MTLALLVDVDGKGGESRLAAGVGATMTAVLLLAAIERFQDGPAAQGWLPLGCALGCAAWGFLSWQRSVRRSGVRLQVVEGGQWRLSALDGGESRDALLVGGWSLGSLISLQLRVVDTVEPAPAARRRWLRLRGRSADCRLLLSRRALDEPGWHALRRYLVWHRRSRSSRIPGA